MHVSTLITSVLKTIDVDVVRDIEDEQEERRCRHTAMTVVGRQTDEIYQLLSTVQQIAVIMIAGGTLAQSNQMIRS